MRRALVFAAGLLLTCAFVGCAPKSLLLVTQYGDDSPRVAEMTAAINGRLKSENAPYKLRVMNLNLVSRVSNVWRDEQSRNAVMVANAAEPVAIFVAGDDAARCFAEKVVGTPHQLIFLDIYGAPSAYKLTASPQNAVSGVVADVPVRELFARIKQTVPAAKAAAVLSDESLQGTAILESIQAASDLPIPVTLVKRARTLADWMAAVQDAQSKADVLIIASCQELRKDAQSDITAPQAEVLQATCRTNRLPDFSFSREAVGANGVLGAVAVPVADQARLAAAMAAGVMYYGENLRNVPVARCNTRETVLSAERAAQLGVNLQGIPPSAKPPPSAPALPAEPSPKPAVTPAEPAPGPEAPLPLPVEPPTVDKKPKPPAAKGAKTTYKVKAGDTLGAIAKQFYGDASKWKIIYDANKSVIGKNPDVLKAKITLVIPDITAAGSAPAKKAPAPAKPAPAPAKKK